MNTLLFYSEIGGLQGGVERFVLQAARVLKEDGMECRGVFARRGQRNDLFSETFDAIGFGDEALAQLAAGADWLWAHKCRNLELVRKAANAVGARWGVYVHDHDYCCFRRHKYFPFTRRNCSRAFGMPCHICGMLSRGHGDWRTFQENLSALRAADAVFAGSDFMLTELAANGVARARLHKLEPLVDLSGAGGDPSPGAVSGDRLVYSGQLIRGKGLDLLIAALPKLRNAWELTVLGSGPDADFCRELARRCGVAEQVLFAGFVPDPDEVYRTSALAIFPSRWQEPYGMSGPEAMSWGVPVVGFDIGGVRDWLHDGENGLLARAGDSDDLARRIDEVLGDSRLRRKLARGARNWVRTFTAERFRQCVENVFA